MFYSNNARNGDIWEGNIVAVDMEFCVSKWSELAYCLRPLERWGNASNPAWGFLARFL
jgi:hypothetical protein